ncbi:MAG TPA: alkane 1-monooxygenase [Candidatus Macondimonas sp.]|nr:alkane 1-monooxygenase [Candidatus Macondimonas sp.]
MDMVKAIWKYGRFFALTWIALISLVLFFVGGQPIKVFAVSMFVFVILSDILLGKDEGIYTYEQAWIFYPLQYIGQVINILTVMMFAWLLGFYVTGNDPFGFGGFVQSLTGYDLLAANAGNTFGVMLSALGLAGVAAANASIVIGHELTHRTENPVAVFMGRIGEAFGMFTLFSIRHPYGHHNLVCTPADPATSIRGENFYHFLIRSTLGQYKMTWDLEKERLNRMGQNHVSLSNRAIRGWLMEAAVALFFMAAAGFVGLLGYLAVGLIARVGLELANYIEHHGLVRVPSEPMQVRHAWNCNHRASNWYLCAINRHSHHHADASVEFWDLKPLVGEAPHTPGGYTTAFFYALIPPLWFKKISPLLLEWDRTMATEAERRLAAEQNVKSGVSYLENETYGYSREELLRGSQPPPDCSLLPA